MDRETRQPGAGAPFIDRGAPLPRSYAENLVVAMVRDPEHLFAYWDVSTALRVAGRPIMLRVNCLSENRSRDVETGPEAWSWHLAVTPDRTYVLELFERESDGVLRLLARSDEVTTPVRWSGESGQQTPAEIVHSARHPLTRPKVVRVRAAKGERSYTVPIRVTPIHMVPPERARFSVAPPQPAPPAAEEPQVTISERGSALAPVETHKQGAPQRKAPRSGGLA